MSRALPLDESDPLVGPEVCRINAVIENSRHLPRDGTVGRVLALLGRNADALEAVIKSLDAKRQSAESDWARARIREVIVAADLRLTLLEKRRKALEDALAELPSLNFAKDYVLKP